MLWMLGLFLLLDIFSVVSLWAGHKRTQSVSITYLHVTIYPLFSFYLLQFSCSCAMDKLSFHLAVNTVVEHSPQTLKGRQSLALPRMSSHQNSKSWRPGWLPLICVISSHWRGHYRVMRGTFPKDSVIAVVWPFYYKIFQFCDIYEHTETGGFSKKKKSNSNFLGRKWEYPVHCRSPTFQINAIIAPIWFPELLFHLIVEYHLSWKRSVLKLQIH